MIKLRTSTHDSIQTKPIDRHKINVRIQDERMLLYCCIVVIGLLMLLQQMFYGLFGLKLFVILSIIYHSLFISLTLIAFCKCKLCGL